MLDCLKRLFSRGAGRGPIQAPCAPYALPRGVPALQEDPEVLRRRLLFGIAFTAVLAGGTGFVAGRHRSDDAPPEQGTR